MQHHRYNTDVRAWAQDQILFLREQRFELLDLEHLIDEVENLTRSQQRSLKSYFTILLKHLLKIEYQPEKHSRSWDSSIYNSRIEIKEIIKESPSLKQLIPVSFEEAYKRAIVEASIETGLPQKTFPKKCLWSIEDVLKKTIRKSQQQEKNNDGPRRR